LFLHHVQLILSAKLSSRTRDEVASRCSQRRPVKSQPQLSKNGYVGCESCRQPASSRLSRRILCSSSYLDTHRPPERHPVSNFASFCSVYTSKYLYSQAGSSSGMSFLPNRLQMKNTNCYDRLIHPRLSLVSYSIYITLFLPLYTVFAGIELS